MWWYSLVTQVLKGCEEGGSQWVWGQYEPQSEFEDNLDYKTNSLSQELNQNKNTHNTL